MADELDRDSKKKLEQEVWSAISAFEQILEAMPNDIASLEALSHAYEQIGDHTRARDYLVRLGHVLIDEVDIESARMVQEKLSPHADKDPRVKDLFARIDEAGRNASGPRAAAQVEATPAQVHRGRAGFSMADELTFAWNLMEAKELTQDEYASVVHDLTEMSATDTVTTISVLHVLEFRAFKNLERIMGYAARNYGTAIVALSSFGFPVEAMTALALDFMVRRGVVLFGYIGPEALAVVMNPCNQELRREVEHLIGKKCHFFLALPSEFDQALTRVRGQLAEKAAAEPPS